ncbi:MAG TPA: ribokinase [Thermomicrobiales bacterium]|nr:ribokinase [Thermomicrobiales bacterium]
MSPSAVYVVGSVNTDLVVGVGALPRPGETVAGGRFAIVGGGKGANAAVAAARLGARVALVACLGDDDFGRARRADLAAEGIDLGGVRVAGATTSGVALIAVEASGENTVIYVPGANALLTPAAVAGLALAAGDVLLTQLETPPATVAAALRRARERGATALLNAAPYTPEAAGLIALADVLVLNEVEAADALGAAHVAPGEARAAVAALLGRGPRAVALTLGAHGAVAGLGGDIRHLPAPAVAVVDTTAAGDAFVGALAAGLAAGADFFAAATTAVAAGSLAVTRPGAQPSLPRRPEVDALLARMARA